MNVYGLIGHIHSFFNVQKKSNLFINVTDWSINVEMPNPSNVKDNPHLTSWFCKDIKIDCYFILVSNFRVVFYYMEYIIFLK
jgi:hypothetical protein